MTIGPAPMCLSCRHFEQGTPTEVGGRAKCAAFPAGIPDAIFWDGRIDHRQPWAGDQGTRFSQDPLLPEFDFDTFIEVRGPGPPQPARR